MGLQRQKWWMTGSDAINFSQYRFLLFHKKQKGQPGLVISSHSAALEPAVDKKGLVQKHFFSWGC